MQNTHIFRDQGLAPTGPLVHWQSEGGKCGLNACKLRKHTQISMFPCKYAAANLPSPKPARKVKTNLLQSLRTADTALDPSHASLQGCSGVATLQAIPPSKAGGEPQKVVQISLTTIWLAAFFPVTKLGDSEDYFLNFSTSDEGLVMWDAFR